eukprot:CAMPEP_0119530264 /NCGR_PEP_ID=MMETSP1344-20130328/44113_1 /TAXON_ID=236787 /ORGANISM="Florenciella parvula, Strain CCMP2471" /LENGTH=31 /DNA_ID= /DNA_START= /DNA_END= /DNA_ORIENTATION=
MPPRPYLPTVTATATNAPQLPTAPLSSARNN